MNAVVRAARARADSSPVWWPRCIDGRAGPRFERNYLQLNSIAAGRALAESFFTASAAEPSARGPAT